MKPVKQKLFGLLSLLTILNLSAQKIITSDMFSQPANTGANMTVGVNASALDLFEGGQIGAFYDTDGDGSLDCVGLESITTGFFGLALWGDDSSTPNVDGLPCGEWPEFYILYNNNVFSLEAEIQFFDGGWDENETCLDIWYNEINDCPYTGYCTNDILYIVDVSLDLCPEDLPCNCSCDGYGGVFCFEVVCTVCEDESACNYGEVSFGGDFGYNESCVYPVWGYDCYGNCLSDSDGDGICDEFEVYGCTDSLAPNYNPSATSDDGTCIFTGGCNCCVNSYGYPPPNCMCYDEYWCSNYFYPDTYCPDSNYIEYYSNPPNWEDLIIYDNPTNCNTLSTSGCSTEIVCCFAPDPDNSCPAMPSMYNDLFDEFGCSMVFCLSDGCTQPEACNYNSDVWSDDGSCFFPEIGYDCLGECLNDFDQDGICDEFETNIEFIDHPLFLPSGWSIFGFTCFNSINVEEALQPIIQDVIIVKDYTGSAYLVDWNYNGIGDFMYSRGYQIKLRNAINNFQFCPTIILTE